MYFADAGDTDAFFEHDLLKSHIDEYYGGWAWMIFLQVSTFFRFLCDFGCSCAAVAFFFCLTCVSSFPFFPRLSTPQPCTILGIIEFLGLSFLMGFHTFLACKGVSTFTFLAMAYPDEGVDMGSASKLAKGPAAMEAGKAGKEEPQLSPHSPLDNMGPRMDQASNLAGPAGAVGARE